jgi:predicted nucleic acid-binding protein
MIIFLDTNVLLDVFLDRAGKPESLAVMDVCRLPENEGWIAWHTLSNGFYIVRQGTKSIAEAQHFAFSVLEFLSVAATTTLEAKKAEQMKMNDIEDAMQIVAAEACGADVIVTSNVKDFGLSPIPVFSPQDFLAYIGVVP